MQENIRRKKMSKIDDIRNKISDLDNMDDLNTIKEIVKNQRKYLAQKNAFGLIKGDKVKITGTNRLEEGIIEKINRTRAVVMVGNVGWNVPFEMLRKI
jgi:transcription antitermination factor NusG